MAVHPARIQPDEMYCIDLIQEESGHRYPEIRRPDDPPNPKAALVTNPYPGAAVKELLTSIRVSTDIVTTDGQQFAFDPHWVWMTLAEVRYMKANRHWWNTESTGAPWVKGKPPIFPPA